MSYTLYSIYTLTMVIDTCLICFHFELFVILWRNKLRCDELWLMKYKVKHKKWDWWFLFFIVFLKKWFDYFETCSSKSTIAIHIFGLVYNDINFKHKCYTILLIKKYYLSHLGIWLSSNSFSQRVPPLYEGVGSIPRNPKIYVCMSLD